MQRIKLSIIGMSCAACQAAVENAVSAVEGVFGVSVSLLTNSAAVEYDENITAPGDICTAVLKAGYRAVPFRDRAVTLREDAERYSKMRKKLAVSAVFALIMLYMTLSSMFSMPLPGAISPSGPGLSPVMFALAECLISLTVIIINFHYFTDGARALISGSPNMNTLVSSGAGASFIYGIYILAVMITRYDSGYDVSAFTSRLFFESVTMILTLVSLGRLLEARSRRKTSEAVSRLVSLTPKTAEVIRDGTVTEINTADIAAGDVVIIRAGKSVPCDGPVLTGNGSADESMLTGESMPVEKSASDRMICGTVLLSGYIEMTAEKTGEDTTVAKITEFVENASSSKAPQQKLADRISRVFVPAVFLISGLTFAVWFIATRDIHRSVTFAISVLVISCPCSLGLATPTAVMCGIGRGATLGILIKSADALEALSKASAVVFDKTGTITEGRLSVADMTSFGSSGDDLLHVASSLEKNSEHPIGRAIVAYAEARGTSSSVISDFTQSFGGGVSGTVGGAVCHGGNPEFIKSRGVPVSPDTESLISESSSAGHTPVLFAKNGAVIGMISVSDTVRKSSGSAVTSLGSMGLRTVMLTGDNAVTAHAVSERSGISDVIAEVKPDEKALAVRNIMNGSYFGDGTRRYTLMVGDGINDAPALAQSDCGISVSSGTDIAMESADVILVKNDLSDVPAVVSLGRGVVKVIRENLAWAFGYNILCIPVAAGVLFPAFGIALTPVIASAAMSLSSICVVTNALRLLRFRPEYK